MSAPPCLKVDLDGTDILPKKRAGLAWGNGVLDNEERDEQREAEAAAKEREEDEFDRLYVEVDASDEEEEEEDEDNDEYAEHIPQSVMMGYISTLSQYGYSDFYKLQLLSFEDWEDLKANVGIDPEHEKHLMEALDIKRPKRKVLKRRDDVDNSSDDDDDDDATTTTTSSAGTVGLESELMAMAMNRRESFQAKSPDGPKAENGSRGSPVMQLSDLEGGLDDAQTNDDADDGAALMSLKDRIAARKKEGSFTDKSKDGQQPSSSSEASTPGNNGANTGDALRDRIQARKQQESSGKGGSFMDAANAPETATSPSPDPATSTNAETSDPKDVLRLRIAARREQTPGQPPPPAGTAMAEVAGGDEEKDSGKGPVLKRAGSKGSTPKAGRGGGNWGTSKDTSPRSRSPRLGMGLLSRGSVQSSSSSKTNPTPPKGRPNANTKGGPNPTPPRQRPSLADRKKAEEERKASELRLSAGSSAGATTNTSSGKVSEVALDADGKLVKPSGKKVEKEKASNKTPERGRGREMDKKSTKSRLPTPGRTGWGLFSGTSSQNSSPAAQRPAGASDSNKAADLAAARSRDKSPHDQSPRLKPEGKSQMV